MDLGRGDSRFQKLKRRSDTAVKHFARDFAQLRFGVVQIIDVNRLETQVAAAAFKLISDEARRHGVAASSYVSFAQDSGGNIFTIEIFARVRRHVTIGRQESALGAD